MVAKGNRMLIIKCIKMSWNTKLYYIYSITNNHKHYMLIYWEWSCIININRNIREVKCNGC